MSMAMESFDFHVLELCSDLAGIKEHLREGAAALFQTDGYPWSIREYTLVPWDIPSHARTSHFHSHPIFPSPLSSFSQTGLVGK